MSKTQVGEVDGNQQIQTISLAFRVKSMGDGLYAAEILMLNGNRVIETRNGPGTTLGHAMAAADDLMDGWAFNEIEQKADDYFHAVFL